jgi:hypothetical protein
MKRISLVLMICLALGSVSCGKSASQDQDKPAGVLEDPDKAATAAEAAAAAAAAAKPAVRPGDFLRLSSVSLSPANPTAATDLNAEAAVVPPVPDKISFQYRWFVNDQQVVAAADAVLPCGNFRKKQWVHCLAQAKTGEKTSDWLMSKRVRIANAPPQLAEAAASNFAVPGQFTFQISASDPDGDELTYELLSPLDQGIVADARTGVLKWTLDAATVNRLGEKIEITFAVSDGDQGKTSGAVTLNLTESK